MLLPLLSLSTARIHGDAALATLLKGLVLIEGTGKRKIDGSKAATRLGSSATQSWANDRYRQVMLLILEFRLEWPGQSLVSFDDVDRISMMVDCALATAIDLEHVGDIYDVSPICWAIWLVQAAHAARQGGTWTVESEAAARLLSFEGLYRFMEERAALRASKNLYAPTTKKLLKRYLLPFKNMAVPVPNNVIFKYRKAALRLSDWMGACKAVQLARLPLGIQMQQPPVVVAAPPIQAARNARVERLWNRSARRSRESRPFRSAQGNGDDETLTRQVVRAVVEAAAESDDDFELEMEMEMEMQDQEGEAPSSATEPAVSSTSGDNGKQLSEYELERLDNILRNEARLRELGLLNDEDKHKAHTKNKAPPPPRPPKAPRPTGPPRRSPRGPPGKEYTETDEDLDDDQLLDLLWKYASSGD